MKALYQNFWGQRWGSLGGEISPAVVVGQMGEVITLIQAQVLYQQWYRWGEANWHMALQGRSNYHQKQTKGEGLRCNFFWIEIKHKCEGLRCNFFGLISSVLLKWPSYLEFYTTWQLTKNNLLVCCDRYSPWKVTLSQSCCWWLDHICIGRSHTWLGNILS